MTKKLTLASKPEDAKSSDIEDAFTWLCKKYGKPMPEKGEPFIMAMYKVLACMIKMDDEIIRLHGELTAKR